MEDILNNWLQDKPKDKFDKELQKYTYYDLVEFAKYYHALQLKQTVLIDEFAKYLIDLKDSPIDSIDYHYYLNTTIEEIFIKFLCLNTNNMKLE